MRAVIRGGKGRRLALAVATLGCAAAFALRIWSSDTYSTGVGEQRSIVLADGSRVTLNTSTDVRVKLTDALRAVTVERGEALFEVAKDANRPFVVSMSDAKVVATGTAFLVRSTPVAEVGGDAFGVTLLEGQVIVQRPGGAVSSLSSKVVLAPGDRLRMGHVSKGNGRSAPIEPRLDRPQLEHLLAWNRGFVVLDNDSLVDAVAELNRYSKVQITVADSQAVRALRVSGVYRTGNNESFAQAVAELHGLVVRPRDDGVELAGK